MLESLHIENAAVIKNCDIAFSPGFSVLTGETGAGKSVLLGALALALGGKNRKDLIRTGEEYSSVSAVFTDVSVSGEVQSDENGEIFVSRVFDVYGKNRCRINGRTVSLGVYRDVLQGLASIHGQNDSLSLLSPSMHLEYLDGYGGTEGVLEDYRVSYEKVSVLREKIRELNSDSKEQERMCELYKMQLDDIDSVHLKEDEDIRLEERLARLKDIEKITKHAKFIMRTLYRSEKGIPASELCKRAASSIEALEGYFPDGEKYIESLNEITFKLEEIALCAEGLVDTDCDNPDAEMDRIQNRLEKISRLKKKYGDTVEKILKYRNETAEKLKRVTNRDRELGELSVALAEAERVALEKGENLSDKRKKSALNLEKKLKDELNYLEMPKVRFKVNFDRITDENGETDFSRDGIDEIQFYFSANAGEEMKPLAEIASGGELSRVMLSLRTMESKGGDTLIFDEIDTGVSGKTSHKIGIRLKKLAEKNQVICVTHSAQIAACADTHFLIKKEEHGGRTETHVSLLDRAGRINELSRIMGGINVTENVKRSAEELLDNPIETL